MSSVELTVTVQDDRTVRARGEGGAESSGKVELDPLRRATIEIFEDWLSRSQISKRNESEVLGRHLYSMLFNGDVKTFFEQALEDVPVGKRLRVQLSFQEEVAELASLPWEYLYCPDTETRRGFFLSTHVDLVLSRYMPLMTGRQPLSPGESPLRILIVVSQPADLGPVVAEPVIEAIQKLANIKIDILDKPTVENFLDKLKDTKPHVLHFIGHGRFNKAERSGEIALLEADEKSARWAKDKEFTEFFVQMRSKPHLIFLHLCEGATVDFTANFAGLAPQLIRADIPAVVAMQYPITNKAAIAFSKAFYRELANGEPIDYAVQEGRWKITTDDSKAYETRVFGTPVLYMRSCDGIIQPGAKKVESEQPSSRKSFAQDIEAEKLELKETKSTEGAATESGQAKSSADLLAQGAKDPRHKLIAIFFEAESRMNQMNLSGSQRDTMNEKLSAIRKELEAKNPDEWHDILLERWDKEQDGNRKSILHAMAEKAK